MKLESAAMPFEIDFPNDRALWNMFSQPRVWILPNVLETFNCQELIRDIIEIGGTSVADASDSYASYNVSISSDYGVIIKR